MSSEVAFEVTFDLSGETTNDVIELIQRKIALMEAVNNPIAGNIAVRMLEYQLLKKEEIKAQRHEYYLLNKEEIKAKTRAYRELNKDKVNAQKRQYREENREKFREIGRRYYERHKDEINARKDIELRRSPFYELFGTRRKVDQEEIVITQQTPFSSLFAIRKH